MRLSIVTWGSQFRTLETFSLQNRGKATYIRPSLDPTMSEPRPLGCTLLLDMDEHEYRIPYTSYMPICGWSKYNNFHGNIYL